MGSAPPQWFVSDQRQVIRTRPWADVSLRQLSGFSGSARSNGAFTVWTFQLPTWDDTFAWRGGCGAWVVAGGNSASATLRWSGAKVSRLALRPNRLGIAGVDMTTEPSDVRVQPVAAATLAEAASANRMLLDLLINLVAPWSALVVAAARTAIISPQAFTMNEWPFDGREAANQAL